MYVCKFVIIKVYKNKNFYLWNYYCDKLYMDYLDFIIYIGYLFLFMLNWYNIRYLFVIVIEWYIFYFFNCLVCFIVECVYDIYFVFF